MVKDHPPHKHQPNKCKTTIIKKRGRQKIICLCINPCQDIARRWLTSHVAAVTLLPSCDPWAGGCGSLQVRPPSSQYQSWAAPRLLFLRHPALSACFPTSSICNILIPCPSVLLKPAGTFWVKKFYLLSPKVSSNWTQNISEVAEIRHGRAGTHEETKEPFTSLLQP